MTSHLTITYLLTFATAFLWTLLLVPFVKRFALRVGAVDTPDHRKVHKGTIPRLGGVAVFLGMALTVITILGVLPGIHAFTNEGIVHAAWVVAGAAILSLVGIVDDVRGLRARHKLPFQILAGLCAYLGGFQFLIWHGSGYDPAMVSVVNAVITIFWVVAVTNAMNLIDGLDGLAAGISIIASLMLGVIAYANGYQMITLSALIIAGSAAGFLRYNLHPAKIFLGDSGSLLLGYLLAVLSIRATSQESPVLSTAIVLSLLSIPLLDTLLAILRRYLKGLAFSHADGEHIHHRLLQQGMGHVGSVVMLWTATLVFGVVALFLSFVEQNQLIGLVILLPTVLWAIVFRRFGTLEMFEVFRALWYTNRRRLSPREKNINVRQAIKRLDRVTDLAALKRHMICLSMDLDLDLLHAEANLALSHDLKKVELVHWNRPPELRSPARGIADCDQERGLSLSKIGKGSKRLDGIACTVILGKESWKMRRQNEDQYWAILLADGLSHWVKEHQWVFSDDTDEKQLCSEKLPHIEH